MPRLIKLLLKSELKSNYPGNFSLLMGIISVFIMASIYYYTSIALSPKPELFENFQGDYFLFVIIAEVCLLAPITAVINFSKFLKEYSITGIVDHLSHSPNKLFKLLTCNVMASYLIDFTKVFMIFLVVTLFFGLSFNLNFYLLFVLSQVIVIPSLVGLGFVSVAIILFLGRGGHVVPMMMVIFSVLAGAYFPSTVFPSTILDLSNILSPFNILLEINRSLYSTSSDNLLLLNVKLLAQGVIFLAAGWLLMKKSIVYVKTKGRNTFILR